MSSISSTSNKNELAEQYAAQQAEKEKLRDDHEVEMERLKQSYNSEKQDLQDRFETTLQHDKLRTYENLRNSKRQFSSAERQLDQAGNERIHQKEDELKSEEIRITKEGEAKVNEAVKKYAAIEEYQRNQASAADNMTRNNLSQNARLIIKDTENKVENLRQNKMDELDRRKSEHGVAVEQIRQHYNQRQNRLLYGHENETKRIQDGVDEQINESYFANANRLEAHLEKQEDPFYRLSVIESDFSDRGDHYQLKVRMPEHERKGFRVQISGQELQFSGTRSSKARGVVEEGHDVTTDNYQTFSERYKFDTPVDAKAMQMTQKGEWLFYTIPKYGPNHRMKEENVMAKIRHNDLAMAREVEFKETLPLPKIVKDNGSGTMT